MPIMRILHGKLCAHLYACLPVSVCAYVGGGHKPDAKAVGRYSSKKKHICRVTRVDLPT